MSLMSICPLAHKIILACTFLKYKLDSPFWRQYLFLRTKKRPETYFISLGFRCPCQGVDATGFEPATSASRTQRSTKLSHASYRLAYYSTFFPKKQVLFAFAPVLRPFTTTFRKYANSVNSQVPHILNSYTCIRQPGWYLFFNVPLTSLPQPSG